MRLILKLCTRGVSLIYHLIKSYPQEVHLKTKYLVQYLRVGAGAKPGQSPQTVRF